MKMFHYIKERGLGRWKRVQMWRKALLPDSPRHGNRFHLESSGFPCSLRARSRHSGKILPTLLLPLKKRTHDQFPCHFWKQGVPPLPGKYLLTTPHNLRFPSSPEAENHPGSPPGHRQHSILKPSGGPFSFLLPFILGRTPSSPSPSKDMPPSPQVRWPRPLPSGEG